MRRRAPNPRRVKIHRSYTVDEIARLYGVHRNTVRNWLKQGLATNDDRRPTLILGWQLRDFLQVRRRQARRQCPIGHLFCVRCRMPKRPALGMVEYIAFTASTGNLRGICPDCEILIHRRVARAKLSTVSGDLDIAFLPNQRRLDESDNATVNCDFGKVQQS
jgi:hypothetical protein